MRMGQKIDRIGELNSFWLRYGWSTLYLISLYLWSCSRLTLKPPLLVLKMMSALVRLLHIFKCKIQMTGAYVSNQLPQNTMDSLCSCSLFMDHQYIHNSTFDLHISNRTSIFINVKHRYIVYSSIQIHNPVGDTASAIHIFKVFTMRTPTSPNFKRRRM